MSSLDYLDLCRLCLVKDRVSVPIFEGEGDVRQIFLKITACLPVKVAREDKLPKKICDDCVYKVELIYQFWHTTANAEKQLLQWLGEVNMEDKQSYVGTVLNPNGMKPEQSSENRLDGTVMQQVGEHQNNMTMGMMDNMGLTMPMMMSSNTQQQITSVPIDNSGSSVQNVQPVAGPSTQTSHDQITQDQTNASTQQEEEEESSEEEENSDDECDGDEGLPIKEESEEDPNNRTLEPTTFVNVSLACDEAGPSGLQQQKIADMPEMVMSQTSDVDPKTGEGGETFGGLSGMLRQILSPSPEIGEVGISINCNLLQTNSIFSNQSSMLSSTLFTPHFQSMCPDQSLLNQVQILAESYPCPTCGLEFRSALKLNYHMRTSHVACPEFEHNIENQPRYTCAVCSRTFVALNHLKMHEITHSASPVTSCASTSANLISTSNNMEKTFACDICQATFRYRALLERHRRMHQEIGQEKPYSCSRCLMRFESRNLYNHHAKTHRPLPAGNNDGRIGTNAVSPVVDPVIGNLGNPVIPAKSMTSYPCDSCSKQFTTAQSLSMHKAVHRSRPLVCDVCGKGFTHRKYYVVHQRIHTGERPYLCAMCGKSFTQASTLTVHRRYHTGERPYTCTLCGKGFVTRTIMINHMKKH
ncbi:zinc finger protein 572-like isoform X13 [Cataglyphis hispanica]|uniref:zinc finger protein 572-like isoform X13 n=1 Tax=Cataglyphis hispanica TaxID=1086592 RepID=UPI00217F467F|nr:zinc finger protein 572-like isoform X13 [Cataglyphis hispanica]